MHRLFLVAVFLLLFCLCKNNNPPLNKFSDDSYLRIAEFQDRRISDSLISFLKSSNSGYRKAAVLALASIQDTTAVDLITELLTNETNADVRYAAAYALGQTGSYKAFEYLSNSKKEDLLNNAFQEALAKSIKKRSDYPSNFNAWGLYRLGLRGLSKPNDIVIASEYLNEKYDENVRLAAAHFFGRGSAEISEARQALIDAVKNDSSVFVRMAAASALRKIKAPEVQQALFELFKTEKDYRVRISILRSLQPYPLKETSGILVEALNDGNINVAIASSEVIKNSSALDDYSLLVGKAKSISNWRVRSNLYEAALSLSSHKELSEEIVTNCKAATNPYEKAALINALGHSPMQFNFVKDQLFTSEIPVIKISSISSLIAMNKHKLFERGMKKSFLAIYQQALLLDDAAVIGITASALADSTLGYKSVITDFQFLYEAKQKLTLPRDNEALQPLEAAIAYFEGKKLAPQVKNEFNHPIDWEFVKSIPRDQHAIIKTAKGEIEIQLFVEEAPGSVANFLQLAKSKYFDAKNFHRVVPNFVIQGGCNRGDGWGSEDYSIRSEFSMRRYKEGSVGMASAGKDTEGTQWFITHSPTPHLDGRYTIFAEVVRGMDVVHRMEVGDQIITVEVLDQE